MPLIHRKTCLWAYVVTLCLAFAVRGWSQTAEEAPADTDGRLAIIVTGEPGSAEYAVKLQGLMEAESFQHWTGSIVERKDIDLIFKEQANSLLSDASEGQGVGKLGQLLSVDYLLTVRVKWKTFEWRLNKMPEALLVKEGSGDRSTPVASLARQLILQTIRTVRTTRLDESSLYVSIGVFASRDDFKRFDALGSVIRAKLRDELSNMNQVVLTERSHISELRNEQSLFPFSANGSSGNMYAPPGDLLVYGEFKPKDEQNLQNKDSVLEVAVHLVSPTGLFKARDLSVTIKNSEVDKVSAAVKEDISAIIEAVSGKLKDRDRSKYDESEFEALKKAALDVTWLQISGNEVDQPAMKMAWLSAQNALMMKPDDVDLLLHAGQLIYRSGTQNIEEKLDACDYIEQAYRLDPSSRKPLSAIVSLATYLGRHVDTETRVREIQRMVINDHGGKVDGNQDIANIAGQYLHSAPNDEQWSIFRAWLLTEPAKADIDGIYALSQVLARYVMLYDTDRAVVRYALDQCDSMTNNVLERSVAHLMRANIFWNTDGSKESINKEYAEFVSLQNELSSTYGESLKRASTFRLRCQNVLADLMKEQGQAGSKGDADLLQKQLDRAMEILDEGGAGSTELTIAMRSLIPELYKRKRYDEGLTLLKRHLQESKMYTSDYLRDARLGWIHWRSLFSQALEPKDSIDPLNCLEITAPWDDGSKSITQLLSVTNRIFGVCSDKKNSSVMFSLPVRADAVNSSDVINNVSRIAYGAGMLSLIKPGSGITFLNLQSSEEKSYSAANSTLPSDKIASVEYRDSRFVMSFSSSQYYEIDPISGTLTKSDDKALALDIVLNGHASAAGRHFLKTVDGKQYTFRTQGLNSGTLAKVSDADGKDLMSCSCDDLYFITDFTVWQEHLFFAACGNLYLSRIGNNTIHCIFTDELVRVVSVCPSGEDLLLGTDVGLFRIDSSVVATILSSKVLDQKCEPATKFHYGGK